MKKRKKKYRLMILACLMWLPVLLRADGHLQTAQKTVVKKIAIAKNLQLSIGNKYGDVMVQQWKQKGAMVRVTVSGQSEKLSRANALINFVAIRTVKLGGALSLETAIDTVGQHINPSAGEQCHINYQVFLPAGVKLSVINRFGNIDIKKFSGDLAIDEKFGDLKIEHSTGQVDIDMEQGDADIDRIQGGALKFKGFTTVRIGELSGAVNAKFWSGGGVDLGLTNNLQKLDINASNVKPLNITNLKLASANLKIHSTVSKIIYNGHIMFNLEKPLTLSLKKPIKLDTVFITGKGDTIKKLPEKLLNLKRISVTAMKSTDYEIKTGTANAEIKIDASFCVVDVRD